MKNVGTTPAIAGPLYVAKYPRWDWYRYLLTCPGGGRTPDGRSLTPAPGGRVHPLTPEALAAFGVAIPRDQLRRLFRSILEAHRESA